MINPQVLWPQRVSWTVEYLSDTHVVQYFMELAFFICCVVVPEENAIGCVIQSVSCQFNYLHCMQNIVFYRWFARNVGLYDMAMVWENWCPRKYSTRMCFTHRSIQETGKLIFYCIMNIFQCNLKNDTNLKRYCTPWIIYSYSLA